MNYGVTEDDWFDNSHSNYQIILETNAKYLQIKSKQKNGEIAYKTGSIPICPLCSHSSVRSKNNSYFVWIRPQINKDIFEVCVVWKNIN